MAFSTVTKLQFSSPDGYSRAAMLGLSLSGLLALIHELDQMTPATLSSLTPARGELPNPHPAGSQGERQQ